jgi:hypothetical protein
MPVGLGGKHVVSYLHGQQLYSLPPVLSARGDKVGGVGDRVDHGGGPGRGLRRAERDGDRLDGRPGSLCLD